MIDAFKIGLLMFAAARAPVVCLLSASVLGGTPDILLVTLVAVALMRGATTGAVAGFFAGLVIDVALLDTSARRRCSSRSRGTGRGRYGESNASRRRTPRTSPSA